MDLNRIPLFEALSKRMAWLGERQTVLAENVANADTPGYTARDLKPPDFKNMLDQTQKQFSLVTTQPGHIAIARDVTEDAEPEAATDSSLDGNRVSLEEQMMKVSQTANDFALTTTIYKANIGMIKSVLGGNS